MAVIIALTGGSHSGKTTLAELAVARFPERFWIAREAATILIGRNNIDQTKLTKDARRQLQLEIFNLQRQLEASAPTGRVILADRATIDGAAYWPGGPEDFWRGTQSRHEDELSRYFAAIWLESAAAISVYSRTGVRTESGAEALDLGERIRGLWAQHPRLHVIPAMENFGDKVMMFFSLLGSITHFANNVS